MNTKQMMICFMIALCFISACNRPNPPEVEGNAQGQAQAQSETRGERNSTQKDWSRSLFGPGPANYGFINHQSDAYDPELEANVTGKSFRSLNAPRQTEGNDQDLIEATIIDMPGFTPGMVILIGSKAWVNVTVETNLNKDEQEEQKKYVEQKLIEANPRYHYEVRIFDAKT
ncbi:hypothetical protein [Salipaludibacillus daqingensis]|uniref:hypothetical protein n=1 Tax=Salipaludibacillus daqingensis TaxID=3041001 RepID=UPI0024770876|nr:hypothetical protein [Salipaludibacillus daqingensis]